VRNAEQDRGEQGPDPQGPGSALHKARQEREVDRSPQGGNDEDTVRVRDPPIQETVQKKRVVRERARSRFTVRAAVSGGNPCAVQRTIESANTQQKAVNTTMLFRVKRREGPLYIPVEKK